MKSIRSERPQVTYPSYAYAVSKSMRISHTRLAGHWTITECECEMKIPVLGRSEYSSLLFSDAGSLRLGQSACNVGVQLKVAFTLRFDEGNSDGTVRQVFSVAVVSVSFNSKSKKPADLGTSRARSVGT